MTLRPLIASFMSTPLLLLIATFGLIAACGPRSPTNGAPESPSPTGKEQAQDTSANKSSTKEGEALETATSEKSAEQTSAEKICVPGSAFCRMNPPPCPEGQVPEVNGFCFGGCVPVHSCKCETDADCPNPNGTQKFTCHQDAHRCNYAPEKPAERYLGGRNCDTQNVSCRMNPPSCPEGQVPEVKGACFGDCVPVTECGCETHADCPDPKGIEEFACHQNNHRCNYWMR